MTETWHACGQPQLTACVFHCAPRHAHRGRRRNVGDFAVTLHSVKHEQSTRRGGDTTVEMNPGEEAQSSRSGSTKSKSTIAVPASWKAVLQASLASNRSISTLSRYQLLLERFLIRGRYMCCWRLAPDVEGLGRFEAPVVWASAGDLPTPRL